MKTKLLLWFVVSVVAVSASAQLMLSDKKGLLRKPTQIEADRGEFDLNSRRGVYIGHVKVDNPEMKLRCEQLTVALASEAEASQPTNIVAEVNVVMDFTDEKGQSTEATGDKAVYQFSDQGGVTNETVALTGNPKVENARATVTGREITWDVITGHMTVTNPKMNPKPSPGGSAGTNAPALKIF
jgi:lipopolysaccharide transport protein LptA